MAVAEKYARAMWKTDSLLATWTPDRRIEVGDVITRGPGGVISVENQLTALAKVALPPIVESEGAATTTLQDGVTVAAAAGSDTPRGAARITLSESRSFLFTGAEGRVRSYSGLGGLRTLLLSLVGLERWDLDWHLVTAVREYSACTLLVAETNGVEAEVMTSGAAKSLMSIKAGAQVSVTSGRAVTYTMSRCTPLYEAVRVRRRFSGASVVSSRPGNRGGFDEGLSPEQFELTAVSVRDIGLNDGA